MTPTANLLGEVARDRSALPDPLPMLLDLLARRIGAGGRVSADGARALGARLARRGKPLESALREIRDAGRQAWGEVLAAGSGRADLELRDVGSLIWELVDDVSAQVTGGYHAALERMREDERHLPAWEHLLGARASDPARARDAVRALGLDGAPYVALRIGRGDPIDVGSTCRSSSWLRRGDHTVGLLTIEPGRLADLRAVLAERATRPVGLSAPVTDPAALGRALRQAEVALRARNGSAGVTAYDDVLPEALLLGAPEVADHLVAGWLGPVLALPEAEAEELVGTLEAWVAAGGSPSGAAATLYCHRNTVLNRLRRISVLIDRELTTPVPLELALSLRAVRARGLPTGRKPV